MRSPRGCCPAAGNRTVRAGLGAHREPRRGARRACRRAASIERDLHDGAQNRLVAVVMMLGMADALVARRAGTGSAATASCAGRGSDALSELRNLGTTSTRPCSTSSVWAGRSPRSQAVAPCRACSTSTGCGVPRPPSRPRRTSWS
ncbi:hypothetical protein GS875_06420, partial [Rhodococcus hoagii]|nr:hypothetical protein [Prescottella equi]